jgi:hypothetical protein
MDHKIKYFCTAIFSHPCGLYFRYMKIVIWGNAFIYTTDWLGGFRVRQFPYSPMRHFLIHVDPTHDASHRARTSVCNDYSWNKNRYMLRGNLRWGGGWRARHTWRVQWLALELEQDLFVGAQWTNHRLGERRNETPLAHSINARM